MIPLVNGPGVPTQEPWTPTPFPEMQRVTQNRFGDEYFENYIYCSIPFSLSIAINASETIHCWIADRDAGNSGTLTNFVRCLIINGPSVQEIDIPAPGTPGITRPVDVDVVGQPPTFTATPAP
ncbi:MAG TPA: hypothetical protein PLV45_17840 [bacterium]|nr:hypothetical protein [bacterium]